MLVFFIKQLLSLKRAILGRREPHQLAWGLALGVLLGLVPHGNLIALAILLFVLSVRVNHGMVAVTAVATSMIAAMLDAQTHAVGKYVLTHPDLAYQLSAAWQWPLVPWTDINNTVVMGSLLVGVAALLPSYLLSYPLFHHLAPPSDALPSEELLAETTAATTGDATEEVQGVVESCGAEAEDAEEQPVFELLDEAETTSVEAALSEAAAAEQEAHQVTIDTQIEVVRICGPVASDSQTADDQATQSEREQVAGDAPPQPEPPMSEALNYLLRQLRDSRQGRAA